VDKTEELKNILVALTNPFSDEEKVERALYLVRRALKDAPPSPLEMLLDMDVSDIKEAIGKAHPSIDDMDRDNLIEKLDRIHALAFKHMNEAAAESALGHYERIDRDA
jgi:hypothetical protein